MTRILFAVASVAVIGGAFLVVKHKTAIKEGIVNAKDRAEDAMQNAFSSLKKDTQIEA